MSGTSSPAWHNTTLRQTSAEPQVPADRDAPLLQTSPVLQPGYLDTEHCIPAVLRRGQGRGRGRAGRVCKVPSHSGLPRAAVRRASTRVISSTARGQELILITSCAWWIARCVTYLARNIWLSDIRESLDRNLKFWGCFPSQKVLSNIIKACGRFWTLDIDWIDILLLGETSSPWGSVLKACRWNHLHENFLLETFYPETFPIEFFPTEKLFQQQFFWQKIEVLHKCEKRLLYTYLKSHHSLLLSSGFLL